MSKTIETRPPQVTLAATIIIVGSVLALVSAWERVAGLRSLETREAVDSFLADPPGSGMGLGREDVLSILQVSAMVAAVAAVATAILGWHVLKGDKVVRRALAIAAVPLFLTGLAMGGFASSFVAAATVMLWMTPAKEWFATGRWTPPPSREVLERQARERQHDLERQPFQSAPGDAPPPTGNVAANGPAPARTPFATEPVPAAFPPPVHVPAGPHGGQRRRPGAVVSAFVITIVSTFVVAMFAVLAIVVMATAPDLVMDEVERQGDAASGLTLAQVRASTYVTAGLCVLMCAIAAVLATLSMGRRAWARRGWMVVTAASAGASFLMVVASPALASGLVVLAPATAAVATLAFLRREEVRRWFASAPPQARNDEG